MSSDVVVGEKKERKIIDPIGLVASVQPDTKNQKTWLCKSHVERTTSHYVFMHKTW
jgi:hypothetical protein